MSKNELSSRQGEKVSELSRLLVAELEKEILQSQNEEDQEEIVEEQVPEEEQYENVSFSSPGASIQQMQEYNRRRSDELGINKENIA